MTKKQQTLTAIIYDRKGNVLSIGKNSYVKTHTLQVKHANMVGMPHKQFLHAEIHAITKCKHISKAYKIFVSRFGADGEPLLAKPCPVCMSALNAVGIKEITYTENC